VFPFDCGQQQGSLIRYAQRLRHAPVHKLSAQLYGYRDTARPDGQHAAANPVACFEDYDTGAIPG
jgi:hypothetical protein